jgi:ribonuclease Z
MKITFLGTCSGTEPIPNFRHTSFIIEHNDKVYWFDAGDNCSYAAHTGNINLLKTRAVFISHTHMDHIGGLPNLLWNIRKLNPRQPVNKVIDIFMPHGKTLPAILEMLRYTENGFKINFEIKENIYDEGAIFEKDGFKVSAFRNNHLAPMDGKWISYSFLIESTGKSVVYSGDVKSVKDIEPLINDVDMLIMETGHHLPEEVCRYLLRFENKFKKLIFTHHGRAVLEDFDGELKKCRNILGDKVSMATDGMTYEP